MDFEFTKEQKMTQEMVREFALKEIAPKVQKMTNLPLITGLFYRRWAKWGYLVFVSLSDMGVVVLTITLLR